MVFFRILGCAAASAGALLVLAGCGSSQPALPSFPEYPPATAYLEEQQHLRQQVAAQESYEARIRMRNRLQALQRADEMWRRTEVQRAEMEREEAFREGIRRRNEQRHFAELREFQSLVQ